MEQKTNEFIEIEGIILNIGSILQVIPYNDWDWEDETHTKKKDVFTIHCLGGGSLNFDMKHFAKVRERLIGE